MAAKIFRFTFLPFLVVMALVSGGATYQTISIVPFWQQDISMFKNYGHWGINYFPILSPLMTLLWLILLVTGFKVRFPHKKIFYAGHVLFLVIMLSTFIYFAPFLLTHMGNKETSLTDAQLAAMLNTWAKWDIARQATGLVACFLFIYTYSKMGWVRTIRRPAIG